MLGFLFILGALYAALAILTIALQNAAIFAASGDLYRTPGSAYGWPYEDVTVSVSGGHRTHGWFLPAESSRGVVLFSHGNAGNIADRIESSSFFLNLGFDVLVYDYGGYGRSTGRPSERRCYEDIRAMWRYLTENRRIPPHRIVLFGRSLGAAMACDLATEVAPAATILESAFLSMPRLAQEKLPILPMRQLIRCRFDNASKISRISSPLLIVHSRDDRLIPIHHGRGLFKRASEPKQSLEIRGEHNDGFVTSQDTWLKGLDAFLTPLLGGRSGP